jgi:prepilin-type N-terminal cleavage/methylation domain-containing protein
MFRYLRNQKSFTLTPLDNSASQNRFIGFFKKNPINLSNGVNRTKSFTLIELLIVIAILALLMSIIIITLNPSEMLKKSRDTKRISNLKSINNALGIFQATRPSASIGTANIVYISIPDSSSTCANLGLPALTTGYQYQCSTSDNYRKTDGTGWIPVNFNSLDIGSPISSLPIDPTNTTSTGLYYTYVVGGSWELRTLMESADQEQAINDGDAYPGLYSLGSTLNLTPGSRDRGLVGYWDFNDGTGTTTLDVVAAHNGTITGATWVGSSGCQDGNCLSFDGGDHVALSAFPLTGTVLTMTGWVKSVAGVSDQSILGDAAESTTVGFLHFFRSRNTGETYIDRVYWKYANGSAATNAYMQTFFTGYEGVWVHFAVVSDYSAKIVKFYRNGVLIQTSTMTGTPVFPSTNRIRYLGAWASGSYMLTDGSLDDIRIYNRELTASEIKAIYEGTK